MAQLSNKHVVVGLGKTGLSCVRFLRQLGCDVAVVDTRQNPPAKSELFNEFPEVKLYCGDLEQFPLDSAAELIVSPGLPLATPAIVKALHNGVPVSGDIELFARSVSAPVIAVTGSNGKSTVVTMLGQALEAAGYGVCVAGNIGLPVLDAFSTQNQVDVWVLELSSFQLETTHSLSAAVAVNLNVSEDHMDRYESLDHYALAKQRIFDNCETAVYWMEDNRSKPAQGVKVQMAFGGNSQRHGRFYLEHSGQQVVLKDGDQMVLSADDLKIKGSHNLLNLAAVLSALTQFNVDYKTVLESLKQFPGLPHRCQWVADINGVSWYNDSKGTNVGAAIAAIRGLFPAIPGQLIWLAGGDSKKADFAELSQAISPLIGVAILYGRDRDVIAAAMAGKVEVLLTETLTEAVDLAHQKSKTGDIVLLSPACASFDQFKNYEARGEHFVRCVKALG